MALLIDFYESPLTNEDGEKIYHARPVTFYTVSSEKIIDKIHERSSLSRGDIKSALQNFNEVLGNMLAEGERVHLEGLGYFQAVVSCATTSTKPDLRSLDVKFKKITFKADKQLKMRLNALKVERSPLSRHSVRLTDAEVDEMVRAYFEEHLTFTRAGFQRFCGFTRFAAYKQIDRLKAEGKIKNINTSKQPIYMAANGGE